MVVNRMKHNLLVHNKVNLFNTKTNSINSEGEINDIYLNYVRDEAGQKVFDYYDELGVFQTKNVLILSSKYSYSYGQDSLNNLQTIFNLKPLNRIQKFGETINKMNKIVPVNGYYMGSFKDTNVLLKEMEQYYSKSVINVWYSTFILIPYFLLKLPVIRQLANVLGVNLNKYLSLHDVQRLMKNNGFKVVNTKTFDGKSYFIAKKIKRSLSRRSFFMNFFTKMSSTKLMITV
jgi:hypothetical protein